MIAQVRGTVVGLGANWLVVDVNGVGMRAWAPPASLSGLREGETCTMYTSLIVREDSLTLYAFATPDERDAFDLVQSASGIGPKIALAVVSVLKPEEFSAAIAVGDVSRLTQVPGIGPKGAQKMILELKDKVNRLGGAPEIHTLPSAPWRKQLREGLEGLGYSRKDADNACDKVAASIEGHIIPPVGELMRAALRTLAR